MDWDSNLHFTDTRHRIYHWATMQHSFRGVWTNKTNYAKARPSYLCIFMASRNPGDKPHDLINCPLGNFHQTRARLSSTEHRLSGTTSIVLLFQRHFFRIPCLCLFRLLSAHVPRLHDIQQLSVVFLSNVVLPSWFFHWHVFCQSCTLGVVCCQ